MDHYANTHESCLERFDREGFVLNSSLDWKVLRDTILIRGRIEYSYQAMLAGNPPRKIFRYDTFHHDPPLHGHLDDHHRHDWEDQSCEWIGHERWPTLSDVLEELRTWNEESRLIVTAE